MIARAPSQQSSSGRPAWVEVILWAAYLACSWTWCIGMFLPVLLVRDYGIMGWVVFAIPNVIGAAAMGWVLRDGMSERIVRDHAAAIEAFRLVTVVFQLWFLLGYVSPLLSSNGFAHSSDGRMIAVVAMVVGLCLGLRHWLGILALLLSLALGVLASISGELGVAQDQLWSAPDILWLAPVCVFGFTLCPYLDPTFHQTRQSLSSSHARWAFTVGFGVFFCSMIVLTLLYAGCALNEITFTESGMPEFIAAHMALQLLYTCAAHARAAPWNGGGGWSAQRVAFAMILAGVIAYASTYVPTHAGLQGREIVYRSFMSFYGLVFPAYVWLRMVPNGPAARGAEDSRRAMRVFWASVGLAAPFYWMGFIERQEAWLAPGLLIVLLARLFVHPRRA